LAEKSKEEIGPDMLSKWTAVPSSDPLRMSDNELIVNVSTVLFAGFDTTSIALRAIIYFLCKNPSSMSILVDEVDSATRGGFLGNPVSYREAHPHLAYLNAVIKEALRMHSPVGLSLERHVPDGGVTISGHQIPANTIVGINPWVLHYDSKVFPEPDSFLPERWLSKDSKKLAEMEKSFFAFGAGSRYCIGRNVAMMEMTKLIPQLLREYDVRLADPKKEWETRNFWFVQQSGVECILTKR
jgi:cytochrome P450